MGGVERVVRTLLSHGYSGEQARAALCLQLLEGRALGGETPPDEKGEFQDDIISHLELKVIQYSLDICSSSEN